LCPQCLLKAGVENSSLVDPSYEPTGISPPVSPAGFVPPSRAHLAARFQQLDIIELLGQGGMGAVYKARQRGLDRLVAVKVLRPEVGDDPTFAERFAREARALARLNHPAIVTVHEFGRADGLFYLVMEYVDGVSLRQTIRARQLAPKDALNIVSQICDALQFAHDEGIVHRDIKPENILLDKRGRVKIADFGLAKLMGQEHADPSLTATNQVMGTFRYMAPEQLASTRTVDHRADIYSLGVVFYELLTFELPVGRFAPPSKKVQLDIRIDEVVLRALEAEPERRYQHASDVKTDLETLGTNSSVPEPPFRPRASQQIKLEESVVERLRQNKVAAIRFYREETGVSRPAARVAVETIRRLYGVEIPVDHTRKLRWIFGISCGALAVLSQILKPTYPPSLRVVILTAASLILTVSFTMLIICLRKEM
jgi:serine/threonine protein kinase